MTLAESEHKLLIGFSEIATGLRMMADTLERGDMTLPHACKVFRELADGMTQIVVGMSE